MYLSVCAHGHNGSAFDIDNRHCDQNKIFLHNYGHKQTNVLLRGEKIKKGKKAYYFSMIWSRKVENERGREYTEKPIKDYIAILPSIYLSDYSYR